MPSFNFYNEVLSKDMLKTISIKYAKDLDVYNWNYEFSVLIPMSVDKEEYLNLCKKHQFESMMKSLGIMCFEMREVYEHHPIVVADSTMDNVFNTEADDFKDFNLPYDAFYINKRFDLENGSIMGIYAMDLRPVLYNSFKREGCSAKEAKKMVYHTIKCYHTGGLIKDSLINICFVYINDAGVFIVSTYPEEIRKNILEFDDEEIKTIKKAYSCVINIIPFLEEEKKTSKNENKNDVKIKNLIGQDIKNKIIKLSK